MSEEVMTRAYLENLSFSELSRLADNYGIDVPENLDRRFLIGELLELNEENEEISDDMIISSESSSDKAFVLPKNYNETQVSCVLRNPGWLFVFWNISDSDSLMLKSVHDYSLKLRICSYSDIKDSAPEEAFEIQTVDNAQEQYILLPAGKKNVKVELVYTTETVGKVLAFSNTVIIPQGSDLVTNLQAGIDADFNPLIKLSDINKIITQQYTNHRHSFL